MTAVQILSSSPESAGRSTAQVIGAVRGFPTM
jgi:hypothetical protein